MTEAVNVNIEEMVDIDMESTSNVSLDDLMADVVEVQTILECNNIGQTIDVNEIYEKLEELTYIKREQRIEYVATQLLHKLGVIDDAELVPEERVFRFSQPGIADHLVANSGCSDERSQSETLQLSGSCGGMTESDVAFSSEMFTGCNKKDDMTVNYINVPSEAILALVNKENQQNSQDCSIRIPQGCHEKSDADVKTLVQEAELIHDVLPHHDINQIYACLKAYRDDDIRVNIVMETFLKLDSGSGVEHFPCTEIPVLNSNMDSSITGPTCDNKIPLCDNLEDNKYPVVSTQEELASAHPKDRNVYISELTDKQMCQELNVNVDSVNKWICHVVDNETEHAYKLEPEVPRHDGKVCEGATDIMPLAFEHKSSEETIDMTSPSVEQHVNKGRCEVVRCSSYRDITHPADAASEVALIDFTTSDPEDEDTPSYLSCSDLNAVVPELEDDSSTCDIDDNLNSNNDCETNDSPQSCNVLEIVQCQAVPEVSASFSFAQESGILETSSAEGTGVKLNGLDKEVSGIIMDSEVDFSEFDTDGTGIFGNEWQSVVPVEVQAEHDVTALAVDGQVKASSEQGSTLVEVQAEHDVASLGVDDQVKASSEQGSTLVDVQVEYDDASLAVDGQGNASSEHSSTSVEVQAEHDVASLAVDGHDNTSCEQTNMWSEQQYKSCDWTNFDDSFISMDDLYKKHPGDEILARLREMFPDASMDYLKRVSHEFDSLTDMANKVLEYNEGQIDVDLTLPMGVPSVSALVPDSSVNALASDLPSQGCRKKEITYEEFRASLPHFDEELLMGVWAGIGNNYSTVKEFIAQHTTTTTGTSTSDQYRVLLDLFPHADPEFLHKKCSMIGNNEAAFKDFIDEQLQNKTDGQYHTPQVDSQYHTLQAMFPQLDSAFLHKTCDELGNDEAAMGAFVVEQLQLQQQNDFDYWYHSLLAMLPEADPAVLRESMNRLGDNRDAMILFVTQQLDEMEGVKFPTLLALLPDADPDYLRATFQQLGNDENRVKEFILEALEKKDYPTREAYLKRQEMAALQRKYKEEFSIEDFIEIFPDPWKHFCEENNNNGNELIRSHGIAYLETQYRRIALDDIRSSFEKNGHNLTLTCSELDKWNGPVYTPRETYQCTVPETLDIPVPFLQEVAFIENEHRIKDFIATQKQWKIEAFEMAKANGELLECMCCYDAELMAEDMAACNEGHLFCKECIRRFAETVIGSAQSGFSCLTECNSEFSLKVLRMVLKPTVFSRMVQKRQLEEVQAAGIEDLENCPFCGFATIPPPDSTVFMCFNTQCMRDSCRKCKRPNHIPKRCEEVESTEVKMRTFIENRMTDALVRSCWKCNKKFIKEGGCNKMTCSCGARMCYICRQPVTDYSHFNGQGGTEFDKCPLYSDLEVIHAVAVQEEGIKAKKEIQAANPDVELKHDPTNPSGTPQ